MNDGTLRKLLALTCSALMLVGCSDSGGGGGGTRSAESEVFDRYLSDSGRWRAEFDLASDFVLNLGSVTIDSRFDIRGTSVTTYDYSGTTPVFDDCEPGGPVAVTSDEVLGDDDFLDPNDRNQLCTSFSEQYTEIDDDTFRATFTCDGQTLLSATFTRLANVPVFDNGTLSFNSQVHPALDTDAGVCGLIESGSVQITASPQPNDLNLDNSIENSSFITVAAPYENARLHLDMQFNTDTLLPGLYDVSFAPVAANEVSVTLSSTVYGGLATAPGEESGVSGTVTLTAVTARTASGTFNIGTLSGDTITGSFTLDL